MEKQKSIDREKYRHFNKSQSDRIPPPSLMLHAKQTNKKRSLPICEKKTSGHKNKPSLQSIRKDSAGETQNQFLKRKALEAASQRKIFLVYGRDAKEIRKPLLDRGWVEKLPPDDLIIKYNLKLGKITPETYRLSSYLKDYRPNFVWEGNINQPHNSSQHLRCDSGLKKCKNTNEFSKVYRNNDAIVNVLRVNLKLWCSKTGLCTSLKDTAWHYIKDVADVYMPRTYTNTDSNDLVDFVNDYLLTACTGLLKWIIDNWRNGITIFSENGTVSTNVIIFALNRCKEYLNNKENKDIDGAQNRAITIGQWHNFIMKHQSLTTGGSLFKLEDEQNIPLLLFYGQYLLKEILKYRPQLSCEGCRNVWIIKPSNLSMGIGIEISSHLHTILNKVTRTKDKYVIQKYVEAPYLIYKTKFDIRQYYLITSTYPLEIWMYKDCFLKFCSQNYNLNTYHESIHLTNQAIQRHYKNDPDRNPRLPNKNICGLNSFKAYLKCISQEDIWDNVVYPGMRKTIVGVMLNNQEVFANNENRFALYGCDFLLDNNLRPWLIEINKSPDLGPSYKAQLCDQVLIDLIRVVIDYAKNPKASTGNFECVYRQPTTPFQITEARAKTLQVRGTALPLHLQSNEKLLDKTSVCLSTGICVNTFSKIFFEYKSLNIIKESDNNITLILNQNKSDDFKSYTEMKTRTDQSNGKNYFDLKTQNESYARTELIAMPEYITDIKSNVMSDPDDGGQLVGNKVKENSTYEIEKKLSLLAKLKEMFWTYLNAYNANEQKTKTTNSDSCIMLSHTGQNIVTKVECTNMTHSKSDLIAEQHNDDRLELNKDKEINNYVINTESNTTTELGNNKQFNSTSEDDKKSRAYTKTLTGINVSHELNKNDLTRNVNRATCTYLSGNNSQQPNCAYKTNIEYNSMTEPDCCDYDKKTAVNMRHIKPNAMSDLYNNDNFDLNSEKEACDYVNLEEPIAIAKLHDGDHLHLNLDKEMCSSMTHLEPNIGTYNNKTEKDSCAYITHIDISLDHMKHGPNAVKEMDNDDHLDLNSDKETYANTKQTELDEMEQSDKFYIIAPTVQQFGL